MIVDRRNRAERVRDRDREEHLCDPIIALTFVSNSISRVTDQEREKCLNEMMRQANYLSCLNGNSKGTRLAR